MTESIKAALRRRAPARNTEYALDAVWKTQKLPRIGPRSRPELTWERCRVRPRTNIIAILRVIEDTRQQRNGLRDGEGTDSGEYLSVVST